MRSFKFTFLIVCLFISTEIWAIEVTLNGISYDLNISTRTASVSGSTLENVIVPETINYDDVTYDVTAITKTAFHNNNTIKTFKSSSIKEIQGYENSYGEYKGSYGSETPAIGAFASASNLVEVYIDNIEKIGAAAFFNDTNLKKIYVGNSLKQISEIAFSYCTSLKYIVIPSSITNIYLTSGANVWYGIKATFAQCPQLTIICLNEGFVCVKDNVFTSPYELPQTVYPSSFFSFRANVFEYSGITPSIDYTFNGIGFGFKPTNVDMSALPVTAGSHTTNIHFTISNDDMSFDVDIPYEYTINPITLTAKVNDVSREYGDDNPQFSSTYTGFVNNEDASVLTSHGTYSTTATAKSDVGNYTIKQTGATAQNYVFEYEDGTLTVNKAPLTMTANDKTITYGSKLPTLDVKYEGLKNNETTPEWDTEPKITTTATKENDAGTYLINIYNADATNYNITTVSGTLTINKAVLSIKADSKNKLYCESNPQLTCSYVGFVNNETESVLSTKPKLSTTATINSVVGIYPIEVSGANATNYNISYQNAELTIKKRELSVTAHNYTRAYGEENPSFELSYTGFVNNENEDVLLSKPKATTVATTTSDVGVYDITIANGVAENYDFNYNKGKLTIEKAYQTLSWNQDLSEIKKYDQVELTATASSGLEITYTLEGDQICTLTKIGKKQYLDCTGEGEAIIIAIQEGNKNYWQSTKVYKPIVIRSSTGINSVMFDIDDAKIFDISGNQINKLQKGVNILKMSNGKIKKVFVK